MTLSLTDVPAAPHEPTPATDHPATLPPRPAAPRHSPAGAGPTRTVHLDNWPVALAVVTIGAFMSVLDISIVNVAIPTMQSQFGVSTSDIEWVTTAYSLALGVVVPVSGWLGERFGLERVYAAAVFGFGVASALCGLSWDLGSEITFRILQAVPGGILPVVTLTMLYRLVPSERIGVGMAAYGLSMVFAPATGPTLGGYLVEYHSWRMIFFLNVPIGVLGAVLALSLLPRFPRGATGRFDTGGFVTVAGGLFTLLLALSKGADWGWGGYRVLILVTVGLLLLALFVVVELEVDRPLLDVRLFGIGTFTSSLCVIGTMSSAFFTVLFYIPLFLQEGQGITPFHTGLAMLPEAIAMALTLPVAGLLDTRVGPRWPIFAGVCLTAWGTYLLCGITAAMSRQEVMVWTSVRGVGQALCMVPLMTAGLARVPSNQLDGASALNNVMQRVAGALGLAVLTTVVTHRSAQVAADRGALMTTANPHMAALAHLGPRGLLGYYQAFEVRVLAQTYSGLFLMLAAITLAAAALALAFPATRAAGPADGPRHLDVGF